MPCQFGQKPFHVIDIKKIFKGKMLMRTQPTLPTLPSFKGNGLLLNNIGITYIT